jgi:glucose/arabinose dehydrogenase
MILTSDLTKTPLPLADTGLSTTASTTALDLTPAAEPIGCLSCDVLELARSADRLTSSIIFVDAAVADAPSLLPGLQGASVIQLNADQDGIDQITQALSQYQNLDSIHIVSHGSSASLSLGSSSLGAATIDRYQAQLQDWGRALTADGDLLLYGCQVADGAAGLDFIQRLGSSTGADVAASTDDTGNADLGGNWLLEATTGSIESPLAFTAESRDRYASLLAPGTSFTYSNFADLSQIQRNGSAVAAGNSLRLTAAVGGQAGSAFYRSPIALDANTSFNSQFRFRLGDGNGTSGADGFAFVLQNTSAGLTALGGPGGAIGYEGTGLGSIALKFDTFQNTGDLSSNFVRLLRDGSNGNPIGAGATTPIDLNSGTPVNAWVDYDGPTNTLRLYLSTTATKPTAATLTQVVDLPSILGSQAYVGFSGGTGGLTNNQDIQNWTFSSTGTAGGGGPNGTGTGLTGTYYDNVDFSGPSFSRTDATVNFDWGNGSPDPRIGADTFSVSWNGRIQPRYSETYTFSTTSDDGVRLRINGQTIIDRFIDQAPTTATGTITLVAGQLYDIQMDYYERGGGAVAKLAWASASQALEIVPPSQLYPGTPATVGTGTGLTGTYYDNINFTNPVLTRTDSTVNFNWGGGSPDPTIGADTFSVQWRGEVQAQYNETYTFYTTTDDGVRLKVNGQTLVDRLINQSPTTASGQITLVAGQKYSIELDYFENGGGASSVLEWSSASQARQVIPRSQLYSPVGGNQIAFANSGITVDESAGTATVNIVRTGNLSSASTVNYTIAGSGTNPATPGQDFVASNGTASFAVGVASVPVSIQIVNDTINEPTETLRLSLGAVTGTGTTLGAIATSDVTITDNDNPLGTITLANGGFNVSESVGTTSINILRTGDVSGTATVNYTIEGSGTSPATDGQDFIGGTRTATFGPGVASVPVNIQILNDTVNEPTETFRVGLTSVSGANLGTTRNANIGINDDDVPLGSGNGLFGEYYGSRDFQNLLLTRQNEVVDFNWGDGSPDPTINSNNFSVRWSGQIEAVYSEQYTFRTNSDDGIRVFINNQQIVDGFFDQGGTTFVQGTINLVAGQRYDIRVEYYERQGGALAKLQWFSPSQALQVVPQSRLYSSPGPGQFVVDRDNITVNENGTADIRINRVGGTVGTATVNFATANGTAIAGSDYSATSGTLTFNPGDSSKLVTVAIATDTLIEANETFRLQLSNATGGATIGTRNSATLFIQDDDTGNFTREILVGNPAPGGSANDLNRLTGPTAIDFTPVVTGQPQLMYIAEKQGVVRVRDMVTGQLYPTKFLDIREKVNIANDRGLIGMAVDPDFYNGKPFLYLAYTYDPPEALAGPAGSNQGLDGSGNRPSRIVRVTADATKGYREVVAGSEEILIGKNSLWQYTSNPDQNYTEPGSPAFSQPPSGIVNGTTIVAPADQIEVGANNVRNIRDYLATDADSHSIGALTFGPNRELYVSSGDGASYNGTGTGDPRTRRAQDTKNLSGKILRINPDTGAGIAGNPFYNPLDPQSNESKVFNWGLRNPFRTALQPGTNELWMGDVGWNTWDEVNRGGGQNYGWPYFEGGDGVSLRTPEKRTDPEAIAFYATNPTVTAPVVGINHFTDAGQRNVAVVVGDFYKGNLFPSVYNNALFFTNASPDNPNTFQSVVYALTFDAAGNPETPKVFRTGDAAGIVQMKMGPDGYLYFVNVSDRAQPQGVVGRWRPA